MEAWFVASANNDANILETNVDGLGAIDDHGRTGLMIASLRGANDVVAALSTKEYAEQDQHGYTAMMIAASVKNQQAIQALIENEAKIQSKEGTTALMCAATTNFLEGVQLLVDQEAGLQNEKGQTALMLAAAQGNIEIVQILIEKEKNIADKCGVTALMYAAASAQFLVFQYLLLVEDQNHIDDNGNSVLHHAFHAFNSLIYIMDIDTREAFQQQCVQCIDLIFDIQKDTINNCGQTILMHCAKYNLYNKIEELEGQVTKQDSNGFTALMYAAQRNSIDSVKLLVKAEAGYQDNSGRTAAMHAAHNDCMNCLDELYTAEHALHDNDGGNVLHQAASGNAANCVQKLKKIYLTQLDNNQQTALMHACKNDNLDVLRVLTEELSIKDGAENDCLMVAASSNAYKCVKFILQQNFKSEYNKFNKSALDQAGENDAFLCIPLLLAKLQVNNKSQFIFDLIDSNAYKSLKVICDVGRTGECTLLCPGQEFTVSEQQACYKQLQLQTQKRQPFADGYDPLVYAVLNSAREVIQVLTWTFMNSSFQSVTPLMLLAQKDCDDFDDETLQVLSRFYAGKCVQDSKAGVVAGTTALMIACSTKLNNLNLIQILKNYELCNVDADGKNAVDYATAIDRQDVVELLKE